MKTEAEIRVEFEGEMVGEYGNKSVIFREWTGFYSDHRTCTAWILWQSCQKLNDEAISAKDAEIARLREALQFYANPATWQTRGNHQIDCDTKPILSDFGKKATHALECRV